MDTSCVECGSTTAIRVLGPAVYPHRPELRRRRFWLCECGAFVGARRNGRPLGRPAGPTVRRWRMKCHAAFDRLWKTHDFDRSECYLVLADAMGLPAEETHFAHFDMTRCAEAFRWVTRFVFEAESGDFEARVARVVPPPIERDEWGEGRDWWEGWSGFDKPDTAGGFASVEPW